MVAVEVAVVVQTRPGPPRLSQAMYSGAVLVFTTQQPDNSAGGLHYVMMRKPDGAVSGPHGVIGVTTDSFSIANPGWTPITDLSTGDRTSYLFGPAASYRMDVVITGIVPRGRQVEITAVPYDARIHAAGA